jgi:ribosomal protein L37AE/L43A
MEDFPGYLSLCGPERYSYDGRPVVTPETYRLWHHLVVSSRNGQTWDATRSCGPAVVAHGTWTVRCAFCKTPALTRPDWRVAYCGECGARYARIEFPAEAREIERMLVMRPMRENQNWFPGETVMDLALENQEHDCRVPDLGDLRVGEAQG